MDKPAEVEDRLVDFCRSVPFPLLLTSQINNHQSTSASNGTLLACSSSYKSETLPVARGPHTPLSTSSRLHALQLLHTIFDSGEDVLVARMR